MGFKSFNTARRTLVKGYELMHMLKKKGQIRKVEKGAVRERVTAEILGVGAS